VPVLYIYYRKNKVTVPFLLHMVKFDLKKNTNIAVGTYRDVNLRLYGNLL